MIRQILFLTTLCVVACGVNPVVSLPDVPDKDVYSEEASHQDVASTIDVMEAKTDAGMDAAVALKPCVDGSWYVRIIPAICQRCLLCQIYATPQAYTIQIGDTIPLLSCSATLFSVEGANKCTYQNMDKCTPVFNYGEGGSETFYWDGTITFQRFTGVIPIGVANGNILWELFNDVEIGRSGLVYGQDAGEPCPYMILMTKEVPQDGYAE